MEFFEEINLEETSIGKVPKDWKVASLETVAGIRGNKGMRDADKIAFIPMELVPDSQSFAKYQVRKREEIRSFTYCEAGDLLLAKITPSLENGKQGIVPFDVPNGVALATTEVFPIHTHSINTAFLFYVLKFPRFRNKIISSMIGTTGRQRASKESVERLKIPLPKTEEQEKIVEVLSTLDSAIELADRVIVKTERLKKGLMQQLLTHGIGHTEYKDTPIGKIPANWELRYLTEVAGVVNGHVFPPTYQGKKNEKYLFAKVNDFNSQGNEKYLRITENTVSGEMVKQIKARIYPPGSIVFPERGAAIYLNRKRIMAKEGTFDNNLMGIIPKDEFANDEFLYYYFVGNVNLTELSSATTTPLITKATVERMKVVIPKVDERKKLAEVFSAIDEKLNLEKQERTKLETVKRGLMDLLLTGKVRIKVD